MSASSVPEHFPARGVTNRRAPRCARLIVAPEGGPTIQTWTSHECAAAWGVKTPTWLGYVARGQAPAPLPDLDEQRRRRWDPEAVRAFPRPGVGRSRAGAGPGAEALLAEMAEVAAEIERLRARQRDLLHAGSAAGLEVRAMSRALRISPQSAYSRLAEQ